MQKGLWQGTYAASDRREYWAEASHAWFHPNGAGSFDLFGNTRRALKQYDPGLATLLAEVYGDKDWQYTPVETRTHQPHLHGFNPKDSPTFDGWPELAALYRQLRTDPSSDGGVSTYEAQQTARTPPKFCSHLPDRTGEISTDQHACSTGYPARTRVASLHYSPQHRQPRHIRGSLT